MAHAHRLQVQVVPGRFAVCRLSADAAIPEWADGASFVSITHTGDELSIVCGDREPAGTGASEATRNARRGTPRRSSLG
jgi:hypothetical protein